jgi:hypothetical protein
VDNCKLRRFAAICLSEVIEGTQNLRIQEPGARIRLRRPISRSQGGNGRGPTNRDKRLKKHGNFEGKAVNGEAAAAQGRVSAAARAKGKS